MYSSSVNSGTGPSGGGHCVAGNGNEPYIGGATYDPAYYVLIYEFSVKYFHLYGSVGPAMGPEGGTDNNYRTILLCAGLRADSNGYLALPVETAAIVKGYRTPRSGLLQCRLCL